GKVMLAALVDTAGYSSAIEEKYQGLLITETALDIGGGKLKARAYGFGFRQGGVLVVGVAAPEERPLAPRRDGEGEPGMPLKIVEQGGSYRLYAGKSFVTVKAQ